MGFDSSKETFIKGDNSVAMLLEILPDFCLVLFFEMNPLKVEFFDCEQYVATIDDLIQNLLEKLNEALEAPPV